MKTSKATRQYLTRYCEAEVTLLASFPADINFDQVLVIPAYKESTDFIARLIAQDFTGLSVLNVVVVNQPEHEQNTAPQQQLADYIAEQAKLVWQYKSVRLYQAHNICYFLLVDRFNQPIPSKQGVGLARKIGADLALTLIANGQVKSHWIGSTDADTYLPANYFQQLNAEQAVAAVFKFSHQSEDLALNQANAWYEKALRYYVAGLTFAGSHYNFFTIGSVLAFNAEAYAKVRGFPKRSAGEDFYLLNKLAKLGRVANILQAKLIIEARCSDRVPFGTGPSVAKILAMTAPENEYYYYHPQIFACLKQLLQQFEQLPAVSHLWPQWFEQLTELDQHALSSLGFQAVIERINQQSEPQQHKQLVDWFDAFKTLKYIHFIRQHQFADIPLVQALQQADF